MSRVWFLLALAACSPPMQPFSDIPNWTSPPDDNAVVRAIVGTGGSAEARAEAEQLARDLLLPTLRSRTDPDALRFALASLRRGLAEARLARDLWPGQPFPEEWEDSAAIDPATIPRAASALTDRFEDIERRYRDRVPLVFIEAPIGTAELASRRILALARNHLHVARTGDHTTTAGSICGVLTARGIATSQLPLDRPY